MPEIDVHGLARALRGGALVIDVREVGEYVLGHVPGAVLMPMSQIPSRLHELPRDTPVYLICASGDRSGAMVEFLVRRGIAAVDVVGGTAAWVAAGYGVERTSAPLTRIPESPFADQ